MTELLMGHRQEVPGIGDRGSLLISRLMENSSLVESLRSFVELAGTVQHGPESSEGIEILRFAGHIQLSELHRALEIGDGVRSKHTRPGGPISGLGLRGRSEA